MSVIANIRERGAVQTAQQFLWKSAFAVVGSELIKEVLRRPVLAPLIGWWLAQEAQVVHNGIGDNVMNVLVFDSYRYKQDLEALAATGALRLLTISPERISQVGAIFRKRGAKYHPDYFREEDPALLHLRKREMVFYTLMGKTLKRRLNLHAAITPAMHYRHVLPWSRSLPSAGVPFVAIHKELTLIDERHIPHRAANYRRTRMTFEGSRLLTTNFSGRKLFEAGGLCHGDLIACVGLPRMDRLLRSDSQYRKPGNRRIATLFSFGHFSGDLTGIPAVRKAHYFDPARRHGFVELSRGTHAAFARAAVARPNTQFLIKPKYNIADWKDEIDQAVRAGTGKGIDEIPNLTLVNEPAPELIRDSAVVVGFNSTVVIESRVLRRPTIVPVFAEAAGKHAENVYFRDYLSLFETPQSEAALEQRILDLVDGAPSKQSDDDALLEKFIRAYIGFDDGRTAERIVTELRSVVSAVPQQ